MTAATVPLCLPATCCRWAWSGSRPCCSSSASAWGSARRACYKYVPNYFPKDVGAVGGLVGMLGALGGFVLPKLFGVAGPGDRGAAGGVHRSARLHARQPGVAASGGDADQGGGEGGGAGTGSVPVAACPSASGRWAGGKVWRPAAAAGPLPLTPCPKRRWDLQMVSHARKTVVVIGNGMVGQRFVEKLVEFDAARDYEIVTFCEEPRPAYDRVQLTKYFEHRSAEKLALAEPDWHEKNGVHLFVGDRATVIDREAKVVRSAQGREIGYDIVVLATGSAPFVPPVPGVDKKRRLRLPHHRRPGPDHRLRRDGEEGGRHRRRAARAGGGQGGVRPRAGNPRRRVRPAPDAAADRRRRLAECWSARSTPSASRSTSTRTPRSSWATARSRGWHSPTAASWTWRWSSSRRGSSRATNWPAPAGWPSVQRGGVVVDEQLRTSDPDIFAIGEVALLRRHDLRPGRARLRHGRDRRPPT